ncbi:MAG TPA: glycosyltransferase family 1 protein [Actinomycetota bacterium]|nr:glycosyltransferase family 1 protein [Actinomycetota bacterium]
MRSAAISVDQLWYDVPGGVGTYIRNLIPALSAREPSLDLALFHARFDRPDPDEPSLAGRRVVTLPSSIRTLYPAWNTIGRPAMPSSLASADVVHATSAVAVPPVRREQRLVVTIHDLAFLRFPEHFPPRWRLLYRLGLRAALRRADAILVPSRTTGEDVLRHGAIDPARVRVTPLAPALNIGTDDPGPVIARMGIAPPYVLFVGTLEPRKNVVSLVRAYRRAVAGGLEHSLVLAGAPGWGTDALERELALDAPGRIVRTGFVPAGDLDAVYRGASMFVYPSVYEGFGLPVMEAMAHGVPTITSNASSLPEVVGDAAITVDPTSVDAIAGAIQTVASDATTAARLADAGRRRAASFTWDETARLTFDAYRS